MSLPRFYAPALDPAARRVRLPEDEARHLTRVLRLGVGDAVAVFDGRGREWRAVVAEARRDAVALEIAEPIQPAAEPRVRLTLAQAVLKPEAMDDVVRDATMMGVAGIDPLITEHVAVKERALAEPKVVERWQRIAVASAKQSHRAVVPIVHPPQRFREWLGRESAELRVMLVEPSAQRGGEAGIASLSGRRLSSAALVVGPEGGWSVPEREAAEGAGCVPISLGALTLRADAVPLVGVALLRFAMGDV